MDRIRQAILDWAQADAGPTIAATLTPDLVNKLRARIITNTGGRLGTQQPRAPMTTTPKPKAGE